MKLRYIVFILSISFLFACQKDNDQLNPMSEGDLIALEGMDEAYESALRYNDSLQLCYDDPITCDSTRMAHYDELYHQFDEMFNFHHSNYSHSNSCDDHHHEGGNNIHHSGMMNSFHNSEQEHTYEHNMESWEFMMRLREMHQAVHPG
jgi:hypothetical protein